MASHSAIRCSIIVSTFNGNTMSFIQEAEKLGLLQTTNKAVISELKSFVDLGMMTVQYALFILKRS